MASFVIEGGKRLEGELIPQGAKNEALQVIAATLLTQEQVIIHNIPEILDIIRLIDILENFGVEIKRLKKGSYSFRARHVNLDYMETSDFIERVKKLRGSILLMGPLLARFGKVRLPKPGGDKIGRRRIDTHVYGLTELGAKFDYDYRKNLFSLQARGLNGKFILLDEASVTGTANLIMAASLAKGKTVIYNAACEPYVQQLSRMLVRMGAKIQGIGSNLLIIEGVQALGGTEHTLLPDMIEVGSFMGLAAITGSPITIKNVGYEHLGQIPRVFRRLGVKFQVHNDDIFVPAQDHYEIETFIDGSILTISDAPWPGVSPDLLSILLVVATQARGSVLIHQKMFESRLFFVDKLLDMGAQIILCDPHRATVIGLDRKHPLRGTVMTSPDIRAGVALLLAALSAEGTSVIKNIEQIDRGYENIECRLRSIGANIQRIDE